MLGGLLDAVASVPTPVRLVVCLFACAPLSVGFRNLRSAESRESDALARSDPPRARARALARAHAAPRCAAAGHVFSIVFGVLQGLVVYERSIAHSFAAITLSYVMMLALPRAESKYFVGLFNFAYVVGAHTNRWLFALPQPWDAAQMILCLKLTALSINYSDGAVPEDKLPAARRANAHFLVKRLPTLLEMYGEPPPAPARPARGRALIRRPDAGFGYCYYGFLAGPVVEYNEYVGYASTSAAEEVRAPARCSRRALTALACAGCSRRRRGPAGGRTQGGRQAVGDGRRCRGRRRGRSRGRGA